MNQDQNKHDLELVVYHGQKILLPEFCEVKMYGVCFDEDTGPIILVFVEDMKRAA